MTMKSKILFSFLVILTMTIVGYAAWIKHQMDNEQKIATNYTRGIEVANCMRKAEEKYNQSIANLCPNPNVNCKVAIAIVAPKLLDPIINTLNKEQQICIKLASQYG